MRTESMPCLVRGELFFFPVLLASLAACGREGRSTLDRPLHTVVLHDEDAAASRGSLDGSASVPIQIAGPNGRAFRCKLPFGRNLGGIRRGGARDVNHAEEKNAQELMVKRRRSLLTAARWAPVRHRCQAWARTEGARNSSQWSYRWCFHSEVMMWSSLPSLQRHSSGWHDESRDESHVNGSVTLHYVNGSGGRSALARCDCGQGPPNITSWESFNGGLLQTLVFSLASCCAFRKANGTRWPLIETFQWLTSPLDSLPCYQFRQGVTYYVFCPRNNTFLRRVNTSASNTTLDGGDNQDDGYGDDEVMVDMVDSDIETDLGDLADIDADGVFEAADNDILELRQEVVESAEGSIARHRGGSEHAQKNTSLSGNLTEVLLGNGISSIRLVPARPTMLTNGFDASQGSTSNSNSAATDALLASMGVSAGAAADNGAAALSDALASGKGGRHRAVEIELQPGSPCYDGRHKQNDSLRSHRAMVRYICPVNWRTQAPQREDGHTRLIVVEKPDKCTTVAWMSSLLICAHDQLLPPSVEPFRIDCHAQRSPAAGSRSVRHSEQPETKRYSGLSEYPAPSLYGLGLKTPFPLTNRSGVRFWIGQMVHSQEDGTRGVVVAWEPQPIDVVVRYLVLADSRHLPSAGALSAGIAGFPGRLSWVQQSSLRPLRGAWGKIPPLHLPRGAVGRVFLGYDPPNKRFIPANWLRQRFPLDGEVAAAEAESVVKIPKKKEKDMNEMVEAFETRLDKARKFALDEKTKATAEKLHSKKEELQKKLADLSKLQQRLKALDSLSKSLKPETSTSGDIANQANVGQLLEAAGVGGAEGAYLEKALKKAVDRTKREQSQVSEAEAAAAASEEDDMLQATADGDEPPWRKYAEYGVKSDDAETLSHEAWSKDLEDAMSDSEPPWRRNVELSDDEQVEDEAVADGDPPWKMDAESGADDHLQDGESVEDGMDDIAPPDMDMPDDVESPDDEVADMDVDMSLEDSGGEQAED